MLKVAVSTEKHIDAYVKENWSTLAADCLSKTDWNVLHTMAEFLEYFKDATLFAQGDNGLLYETLLNLDLLHRLLSRRQLYERSQGCIWLQLRYI